MATPAGSAKSSIELTALEERLGYRFAEASLLALALRHRSLGGADNERLEFLGDSVVGLVISDYLFLTFPDASEGALTTMRANLVCRSALVEVARQLELRAFISLGGGVHADVASGDSLLADTLESVCGAIYLDGGFEAAQAVILQLFAGMLAQATPHRAKDPKTRLQEHVQSQGFALPQYRILSREGPDHRPHIRVECVLPEQDRRAEAGGPNRRAAERAAAELLLLELEVEHD